MGFEHPLINSATNSREYLNRLKRERQIAYRLTLRCNGSGVIPQGYEGPSAEVKVRSDCGNEVMRLIELLEEGDYNYLPETTKEGNYLFTILGDLEKSIITLAMHNRDIMTLKIQDNPENHLPSDKELRVA